jgi:hypothetical protein
VATDSVETILSLCFYEFYLTKIIKNIKIQQKYGSAETLSIYIHIVSGFISSLPNWVPPPPQSEASVAPLSLGPRGETHSLAGEGMGGPNSNEVTDTLVLYVYYNTMVSSSIL